MRQAPVPAPLAAMAAVYAATTRSAGDAVVVFSRANEGPNRRVRSFNSLASNLTSILSSPFFSCLSRWIVVLSVGLIASKRASGGGGVARTRGRERVVEHM